MTARRLGPVLGEASVTAGAWSSENCVYSRGPACGPVVTTGAPSEWGGHGQGVHLRTEGGWGAQPPREPLCNPAVGSRRGSSLALFPQGGLRGRACACGVAGAPGVPGQSLCIEVGGAGEGSQQGSSCVHGRLREVPTWPPPSGPLMVLGSQKGLQAPPRAAQAGSRFLPQPALELRLLGRPELRLLTTLAKPGHGREKGVAKTLSTQDGGRAPGLGAMPHHPRATAVDIRGHRAGALRLATVPAANPHACRLHWGPWF